jgi:hypothetical protein
MECPVYLYTAASHYIGTVEASSKEEYLKKAEALWESQSWDHPTTNCHNEFDLGDWDIDQSGIPIEIL